MNKKKDLSNFFFVLGVSRAILAEAGLPVPEGVILVSQEDEPEVAWPGPFPAVVKPTLMENSVGVEMVRNTEEMRAAIQGAWQYGNMAIIDRWEKKLDQTISKNNIKHLEI